jgi:hypothetical protein
MVLLLSILFWIIIGQLIINLALFIWKVITPRGRMYYYGENNKVSYFGYVFNKTGEGSYTIVDVGKMPGNREVGEVLTSGEVRIKKNGGSSFESYETLGFIDTIGVIMDKNKTPIAKCIPQEGERRFKDLFLMHSLEIELLDPSGNLSGEKLGRATDSLRFGANKISQVSRLKAAAAALTLFEDEIVAEAEGRSLPQTTWKDLALLTTLIYVFFYAGFAFLMNQYNMYPAAGQMLSFVLGMLSVYFMLWWSLHMLKTDLANQNVTFTHFLNLVNRNTSLGSWNAWMLFLASIGLCFSIFIEGYDYVPLFLSILIGGSVNWASATAAVWKVASPSDSIWVPKQFKTKREKVKSRFSGSTQVTTSKKTFTWDLKDFGIDTTNNPETVEVSFVDDYLKPNQQNTAAIPITRRKNPFYGKDANGLPNWEKSKDIKELSNMILIVLNGSDESSHAFPVESDALNDIINSAASICKKHNLADFEILNLILGFCQDAVKYKLDNESASIDKTYEYVRFSIESLYDGEGDCDCTAALAYQLFKAMGVDVKYAILQNKDGKGKHAAVLIKKDNGKLKLPPQYSKITIKKAPDYAYCETTAKGWRVGVMPSEYDPADENIIVL